MPRKNVKLFNNIATVFITASIYFVGVLLQWKLPIYNIHYNTTMRIVSQIMI